jgi:hypothetical protein
MKKWPRSYVRPIIYFLIVIAGAIVIVWWINRLKSQYTTRESQGTQHSPHFHIDGQGKRRSGDGMPRSDRKAGTSCESIGVTCTSTYFTEWHEPAHGSCSTTYRSGYPLPDPRCTPGGIDTSVSVSTLTSADWRTGCIRNCETTEHEKEIVYTWYNIEKPAGNFREGQICELDHLVPLELGGADGLGNIWPQCGPQDVVLSSRYFKVKDRVENYLAEEVRAGRMSLGDAQKGIADDWTQYLDNANRYCGVEGRC